MHFHAMNFMDQLQDYKFFVEISKKFIYPNYWILSNQIVIESWVHDQIHMYKMCLTESLQPLAS